MSAALPATDATRLDPTLEADARARTLTDVVGTGGGGGASSAAALELAMVTKVAEEAKELRAALAEYKRERDGARRPPPLLPPLARRRSSRAVRARARPAARRVLKSSDGARLGRSINS